MKKIIKFIFKVVFGTLVVLLVLYLLYLLPAIIGGFMSAFS